MKTVKYIGIVLLATVILISFNQKSVTSPTANEALPVNRPIKLIVATDLHYLSPVIVEKGEVFEKMYLGGDGKQMNYMSEITDAFIEDVIKKKPDGLILSGDLTFNGEKKSHEELAEKLKKVEKSGIPVMVIPGNHDINNFHASGFAKNSSYPVETIGDYDFRELYGSFGYGEGVYQDPNSLSYVLALSEDVWLFMIDSNRYSNNNARLKSDASGAISKDTLKWLKACLEEAKTKDVTPITVMHHNLLNHNELFQAGFTINNSQDVLEVLKEYDVKVNLSGHIHAQHIADDTANEIYDIVTSALSVYPNQYGTIHISPQKEFTYETQSVDVETWAKENKITNEDLLQFKPYSYQFFYDSAYHQTKGWLKDQNFTETEIDKMAKLVGEFNAAFFSGTVHTKQEELLASEGYAYWEKTEGQFMKQYMDSVLLKPVKDENELRITLQ